MARGRVEGVGCLVDIQKLRQTNNLVFGHGTPLRRARLRDAVERSCRLRSEPGGGSPDGERGREDPVCSLPSVLMSDQTAPPDTRPPKWAVEFVERLGIAEQLGDHWERNMCRDAGHRQARVLCECGRCLAICGLLSPVQRDPELTIVEDDPHPDPGELRRQVLDGQPFGVSWPAVEVDRWTQAGLPDLVEQLSAGPRVGAVPAVDGCEEIGPLLVVASDDHLRADVVEAAGGRPWTPPIGAHKPALPCTPTGSPPPTDASGYHPVVAKTDRFGTGRRTEDAYVRGRRHEECGAGGLAGGSRIASYTQ